MIHILFIMVGGGIGAVIRAWLTDVFKSKITSPIPIATLIVNLVGSFLIGFCIWDCSRLSIIFTVFITGVLGGLTTFSTLSYELVQFISPSFKPVQFLVILFYNL